MQVGSRVRQRCSWCGAVLIDYDLTRIAVPVGQEPGGPGMWETGRLVFHAGGVSYVVAHEDGRDLPAGACALLDDAVTV